MKLKDTITIKLILPIYILAVSFVLTSCKSEDSPVEPNIETRGGLISSTQLPSITKEFIKSYLNDYNITIDAKYNVDAYKIVYYTDDTKGNLTIASGALFIPQGKDNLPLISLHHGTQTDREKVGSVSRFNAPEGIIGAALGYYSLVPDYLGLGESQLIHPYLYAKSSADAVIDFIRACRKEADDLNIKLNGQVFLAGYSEGGYVTLAAHREIQLHYGNEITITASSPMAGPYDPYLTSKTILENPTYGKPSYMAYLAAAYNSIYGWNNLKGIFNSPYAELIPSLIDGTKTIDEIDAQLTSDLTKLFTQNFLTTFLDGTEKDFSNALRENNLIDWTPAAPIRFYHGSDDQFVPYQNSIEARDYFLAHGANVELVTIEGGDHATSLMPSILGAIDWFDSIRLSKVLAYK